jgi:phage-related baseplate assembly protein
VCVGHDAFMDFQIPPIIGKSGSKPRRTVILACASKSYFASYLRPTGAQPLLWTTGLMAPEAYTLKAALDGWIAGEPDDSVRARAAAAYDKYQNCGSRAALRLFSTVW